MFDEHIAFVGGNERRPTIRKTMNVLFEDDTGGVQTVFNFGSRSCRWIFMVKIFPMFESAGTASAGNGLIWLCDVCDLMNEREGALMEEKE